MTTINEVAARSGIKAATIRRVMQRFGHLAPSSVVSENPVLGGTAWVFVSHEAAVNFVASYSHGTGLRKSHGLSKGHHDGE